MTPAPLVCLVLLSFSAPVPKVKVPEYAVHLRVSGTVVRVGEPILVYVELHNNTDRDLNFTFDFGEPTGVDELLGSYLKVRDVGDREVEFRPALIDSTCYGKLLHPRLHSHYTPSLSVKAGARARCFDRILPPTVHPATKTTSPFPDAGKYELRAAFRVNGRVATSKPVAVTVIDDRRAFEADTAPFAAELDGVCWVFGSRRWHDDVFSASDGVRDVAKKHPESSLPRLLRTIELLRTLEKLKTKDEKLKHIEQMVKAAEGWGEVDAAYLWCQALHVVGGSEDEVVDALTRRITLWDAGADRISTKREKENKK